MYFLALGRWGLAAGRFFIWKRIYWKGKWTPFVKIEKRYDKWRGSDEKYCIYKRSI